MDKLIINDTEVTADYSISRRHSLVGELWGDLERAHGNLTYALEKLAEFRAIGQEYDRVIRGNYTYTKELEKEIIRLRTKYEEPVSIAAFLAAVSDTEENQ